MLLNEKVAVVYGGGGIIGSAVARVLAREGATAFIAGRSPGPLDSVMSTITDDGGQARSAVVDATDEEAVERHLGEVVDQAGSIDILFNAVTHRDVQGTPLLDLETSVMSDAVLTAVRAQTTIRAAARHMVDQGSGVILTNVGHGPPFPGMGTTVITWQLVEALYRQWAVELGPQGVRVAWTRIGGTVDAIIGGPDYGSSYAGDTENEELLAALEADTMLRRLPSALEIADTAAFLASDRAGSMTSSAVNLTDIPCRNLSSRDVLGAV